MAHRIYISPSNQEKNRYVAGGTNEAVQCNKIGVAVAAALERCGFETKVNGVDKMALRVKESDAWGADLHLPIHTNAHNGKVKGTRLFCYDKTGKGHRACMAVMAALAPITPGTSDSITVKKFYEVKYPKAPTAYIEVGFHDNPEEAQWIIDNTEDIAEAICKGVCDYFGVEYVAPSKTIYRVQVGAFEKKEYAQRMVDSLKAAGFGDAYIKQD